MQEKEEVCGGKGGEIGGYGYCCRRGDGLIEGFLLCCSVVLRLWRLKTRWREKKKRENCRLKEKKEREVGWFFINFSPNFLHTQGMESTPIYRGWKRNILSLMVSNLGPWFSPGGSQPLAQSRHHELLNLTVEGCLSKPLWAGTMTVMVSIGYKVPLRGVIWC